MPEALKPFKNGNSSLKSGANIGAGHRSVPAETKLAEERI